MRHDREFDDIVKDIAESPSDMLSIGRTVMANERTLLSFIKTSIGLLASGLALIKFFEYPLITVIGWVMIPTSVFFLLWGIKRYRYVNKLLRDSHSALKSKMEDAD
jgi:putative membrane protein